MTRRFGKKTKFLVATVVVLVVAGTAAAYWTTTGSGAGSASVRNPDPVSISAGSPTGFLYPGTSADLAVTITDPNRQSATFNVYLALGS